MANHEWPMATRPASETGFDTDSDSKIKVIN